MRALPIALLVAAAALAACSSGDQQAAAPQPSSSAPASSSSAPAGKPGKTGDTCSLLSANEVGKAINIPGVTAKTGPTEANANNGGKATSCEYLVGDKQAGALAVTRYEGRQAKPADMIAAIKKAKAGAVDVPGFPDGAVYYLDGRKTATLAAAKVANGVPVLVNYTGPAKMTQQMMVPLVHTAVTGA
ncbi:DUF3558 family protein [Amycolatopsis jiangsuensis]|uniref:DUF3558 domain-containing protein n=1 Tax=Amycolatopsis jiangsuensis TaxID=1181879 RepID=A0A840IYU9_9PSEU|nr:DUF3558 family protein [Amycolatopsis jiangsuensis]MBB4688041.1 hypothetical protein [Amycolatopsis jiangsuensis]